MYFVGWVLIWKFLEVISNRQLTEEIGGLIGIIIIAIYTVIYISFFWGDLNWIDIFNGTKFKINW